MKEESYNLFDIFMLGADYGLLKAEEERESEDTFNAFSGYLGSNKYNSPVNDQPTRQVRSEEWFKSKRFSKKLFLKIFKKYSDEKFEIL